VRTLDHASHSGMFGGAVPDAMLATVKLLSTLWNEDGSVAVEGLTTRDAETPAYDEATLRDETGLLEGVTPIGDGTILSRIWNKPSITVTGIDAPSVANAVNAVQPVARARVTVRVPPAGDPKTAVDDVIDHLRRVTPWGAKVVVDDVVLGSGFLAMPGGAARTALNRAMERAYGRPPRDIGAGGSIPLVATLSRLFPVAEILLFGAEDDGASIHAPNERVDLEELRRTALSEALFLAEYGAAPLAGA